MVQQCVRMLTKQRHLLRSSGLLTVTSVCHASSDKKGKVKRRRIALDWRKVDRNPANIPSDWIPDSWKTANNIDYEREKELAQYIPGYDPKIRETEHPNFHETPIYQFNSKTKLLEGLKQSLCLTKCVLFEELPENIQQIYNTVSIPDQDEKVIQILRHCLLFDIDPKILTKDAKYKHVIQDNNRVHPTLERYCPNISEKLLRLCQSQCYKYPDLLRRIQATNVETSTIFHRKCDIGMDSADHLDRDWWVMLKSTDTLQLLDQEPLRNFADATAVGKTETMSLPDTFPVFPVVDLEKTNLYEPINSTGLLPGFSHSHIHTLILHNIMSFSPEEMYGQMTSNLFSSLFSRAVEIYGDTPIDLPTPISGQCIASDGKYFQFMCMQLNTTQLDSDSGIKNMVWIDNRLKEVDMDKYGDNLEPYRYSAIPMYEECSPRAWRTPEFYTEYDPTVFQTFLSLLLNGAVKT